MSWPAAQLAGVPAATATAPRGHEARATEAVHPWCDRPNPLPPSPPPPYSRGWWGLESREEGEKDDIALGGGLRRGGSLSSEEEPTRGGRCLRPTALPLAARAAVPAAAHPLMSPAATPSGAQHCAWGGGGGWQAGAPAGALEATHAAPWPLRTALPVPAGAPRGPRSSSIRREEGGWGSGTQKFVNQK